MKKHIQLPLTLTALMSALLLAGCSTPAQYVDSKGPATIVSLDKINIQDFTLAADDLVADLLASGVVERAPSQPAVMAVSRVINNTKNNFDMGLLTEKISASLMRTGKITTISTDQMAKDHADKERFLSGSTTSSVPTPYYTLSGKIIDDTARAGNINQTTYIFQLTLTTVKDNLSAWKGEKQITKQGKRATVGW